jgi:hypothetical protein
MEDKMIDYVSEHGIEIYIDYNDSLTDEQVELLLQGKKDEAIMDIEDWANQNSFDGEFDSYWEEMCSELGCNMDDVSDWLQSVEGMYPSYYLDEHGWRQLLRNTSVYVEAVMWDVNFNMNNWAYGYPVTYSDVKETLKLFGINPKEFHDKVRGGSMTSGEGKLKGWFPDMPERVPKIDIKDLWDGMCSLYDGVVVFCLGDLENIAEVLAGESKTVTFQKGTNVVIYEFAGGAGITDFPLIEDLTVPRKAVDFRVSGKYGIQDCYGFTHSYWNEGAISLKGKK